jgi:hypothetical protein
MRIREQHLLDIYHAPCLGRSVVIPLPGDRALRIGFKLNGWFKLGPRRYRVVAAPSFVESMGQLVGGEAKAREWLHNRDIPIQGELKSVSTGKVRRKR